MILPIYKDERITFILNRKPLVYKKAMLQRMTKQQLGNMIIDICFPKKPVQGRMFPEPKWR